MNASLFALKWLPNCFNCVEYDVIMLLIVNNIENFHIVSNLQKDEMCKFWFHVKHICLQSIFYINSIFEIKRMHDILFNYC